jgi:hypothetical protein
LTSLHVKVCDFSIPRLQSTRHLATPFALRPPQAFLAILNAKTDTVPHAAIDMDVWALAVLIHLLFTYQDCLFGADKHGRILSRMVLYLGKFPKALWESWGTEAIILAKTAGRYRVWRGTRTGRW